MSYQVLARKWRPQVFTDVVGQEHVLTTLQNSLALERIHHAYLFSGASGIGKTTIARLLAKGLNCEAGITSNPCRACDQCRDIAAGFCLDLIEIDAASRTKVEDIRDVLENVQYTPSRSRFKIYLIDEVHMLSRHSFNALLKTLEEPPSHVKFILATTDPQKIPMTILSRCLHLHLAVLKLDQIFMQLKHVLKTENIYAELGAIKLIAQAANGSMRNSLSLADQAIVMGRGSITTNSVSNMLSILDDQYAMSLIEYMVRADGVKVMELLENVAIRGGDWDGLLIVMLGFLHRMAIIQLLPSSIGKEHTTIDDRLQALARTLPPTDLQLYYQILLVGRKELQFAPNQRMGVEMTLLRALAFKPEDFKEEERTNNSTEQDQLSCEQPISKLVQVSVDLEKKNLKKSVSKNFKDSDNANLYNNKDVSNYQQDTKVSGNNNLLIKIDELVNAEQNLKMEDFKHITKLNEEMTPIVNLKKKTLSLQLNDLTSDIDRHVRNQDIEAKIVKESWSLDSWSSDLDKLHIPEVGYQLALHSWREVIKQGFCLHIRSSHSHLNTPKAYQELYDSLIKVNSESLKLIILEDDNHSVLTPLEWRYKIYQEKIVAARKSIINDSNIQSFCYIFHAVVQENSIQLI
ncbi:DNA polymerase III subunit gamma/tau [Candidatus Erwinia haradaeae]|uniref:DNA polymerase III subunit gamma/tau n=1 Tax=Candidatus Erwinia haradaeae TaxID=1922217 RepID=A0A451DKG9_9GAMM|nr:DNA polymerase III subunit gamma/tau [Candidatus Erwinia haradaeae]VFP87229.1 DNA polymerase III subunit tau [Candidatus Erwinia haradaeae]